MSAKTVSAYVKSLARLGRVKLLTAVALIVGCSMLEGASLLLILPILHAAGFSLPGLVAIDRYAELVVALLRRVGLTMTLGSLLAVWLAALSARALLVRQRNLSILKLQQNYEKTLRTRLYGAIVNANWLFLCRFRGSNLVDALTVEISRLGQATYSLLSFVATATVMASYVYFAFKLSPTITALVGFCALCLALLSRGRTRRLSASGSELSRAFNDICAATVEQIGTLKATKAYNAEKINCAVFAAVANRIADTYLEIGRHLEASYLWFELGSALILAALLYLAIDVFFTPHDQIVALVALFARMMPQASRLQNRFQTALTLLPAFKTICEMEAQCIAAAEPALLRSEQRAPEFCRVLRLENVSFSYDSREAPVLHDVTIAINCGQITAIIGPSGAGKSTIADILMGLVTPQHGRVTVDGVAMTELQMRAWRERVGYVAQDTFLLHDTIRANLRWAHPQASETEMYRALEMAAAGDFVARLPKGLDTVVGDRGILLSHGERQRIALARALLRQPQLLVLDEALNSLDSETEQKVWRAVEGLRGKVTVIVIAHRLATVRWADMIYVVENGEVVEAGDFNALFNNQNGRLRALFEAQKATA